MKHEPEHEQYIGKPLSDCPDGTKAVVANECGFELVLAFEGGEAHDSGGRSERAYGDGRRFTVIHILALGKPRPKTLAEEEDNVVWGDGERLYWRGEGPETLSALKSTMGIECDLFVSADEFNLKGYTRLGPITGIEINGEVWRGGRSTPTP